MNRQAIDRWLEWALLVLILALLTYGVLALGAVRSSEFVVLQWITLAVLGVWLLRIWIAPQYRFLWPPTAWAILPFVGFAVWRYREADIEYVARLEFLQVIIAALLFLAVVNNLFAQGAIRILALGLIAVGTLVAMYGIYQWLTGTNHVWHFERPAYRGRGSGTFISPNHLAGFLEMLSPLALVLTVLPGFGALPRIFLGYASFVMLAGLATTSSRGGWVAAAMAFALVAIVLVRKRANWWAALALLLFVGGTGAWFYSSAIKPRLEVGPSGKFDDARFRLWDSAQRMWKDHPWVGVGPAHFDYRYRAYRHPEPITQPRPGYAHNDYWNTLVDWGLIGLILIITPVFVAALGVLRSWKSLHRSGEKAGQRVAMVLGAGAGIAALLIHSFFDFNMHIPANALVATTLLAIVTTHWRYASQNYWLTARWPLKILASFAIVTAGFYVADQTWQRTWEVRALARAEEFPEMSGERIAALEAAFRIEPRNAETALAIAEQFRSRAWTGDDEFTGSEVKALAWFKQAEKLNRWDPYASVGAGACLDWMGKHDEAGVYFSRALKLDPNHWYMRSMMGWHYYQMGDLSEAQRWFKKSLEVYYSALAWSYLDIVQRQMADQANSQRPFRSLPEFN